MKNKINILLLMTAILFAPAVKAGPASENLSTCFADKTNGKDRKNMAQWIFVSMAAHPSIKALSNIDTSSRSEVNKNLSDLATRLLTVDCKKETMMALERDGALSMEKAFGTLGQLAMQELLANPSVNESISDFSKRLDIDQIKKAVTK